MATVVCITKQDIDKLLKLNDVKFHKVEVVEFHKEVNYFWNGSLDGRLNITSKCVELIERD